MMAANRHAHTDIHEHIQHLYLGERLCTQCAHESVYIQSSFSMSKGRDGLLGARWTSGPSRPKLGGPSRPKH